MKTFEPVSLDPVAVSRELDELAALLSAGTALRERNEIAPFFSSRKQLSAAIGYFSSAIELPDRLAFELDLFGDFTCDLASGDSARNAYILVEFENAVDNSIFLRLERGKTMKRWSRRFEHGFSQLVDWAWRLSCEGPSDAYDRILGARHASIHLLLIAGRDSGLTRDDLPRLEWPRPLHRLQCACVLRSNDGRWLLSLPRLVRSQRSAEGGCTAAIRICADAASRRASRPLKADRGTCSPPFQSRESYPSWKRLFTT